MLYSGFWLNPANELNNMESARTTPIRSSTRNRPTLYEGIIP